MRRCCWQVAVFLSVAALATSLTAQHDHPAPEKLGAVDFATSCSPKAQAQFNRAMALLHSFAYNESEKAFREVIVTDPTCAMARWGVAMSYYHQLWEPPVNADTYAKGKAELAEITATMPQSKREAGFIGALKVVYSDGESKPLRERMLVYEARMAEVAKSNPGDTEAQVFYALALLSTAPPTDKTHANQKKAVAILEPLYAANPQHPGLAHYLIHATDNAEMARHGVKAAQEYSKIAPSAPHALHMPSHIFTRLGMWNESVASNEAARRVAHEHGDVGEELHAMDYLTYAYLQLGSTDKAVAVVSDLHAMQGLKGQDFKVGYASTAMPVRLAVERGQWQDAAAISPAASAPPEVAAVAVWARAIGLARTGRPQEANAEIQRLSAFESTLRKNGRDYWADQLKIQTAEAEGWVAAANKDYGTAQKRMTDAAALEDSVEKLPLTPGPIVPAREQLGELLLMMNQPAAALTAFEASLAQSPGRRNGLVGAHKAAELSKNSTKAAEYSAELQKLPYR